MSLASICRLPLAVLACFALGSCGGSDGSSPAPPLAVGGGSITPGPTATPTPTPTPTSTPTPLPNPPATNLLPPAPFALTGSADFSLVGWQQTSQGSTGPPLVAPAEQKGTLAWFSNLGTYAIALSDLGSGRLVYTFPPSINDRAFSIVQEDGSIAKTSVSISLKTTNVGEIYWQLGGGGVSPYVYAHAFFGIPIAAGSLPTSGQKVFVTDTNPQSAIVFDFTTRKVSGTVTSFLEESLGGPAGPKERATIEPADLQSDGSFVAAITIPGAPRKGELRGRLFGSAGNELAVYWNAPVRVSDTGPFIDLRAVMTYLVCSSCAK